MRTDVIGIVFADSNNGSVRELTSIRCMGSVPFGGRYRLIDFPLSNLVNAGISKVGISTKTNYRSLMDHIGSGKPWDLARKKDGIFLFPPNLTYSNESSHTRIDELAGMLRFLSLSKQKYVAMFDCDAVCNIDVEALVKRHEETAADVTFAYKRGVLPETTARRMVFSMNKQNHIEDIVISPDHRDECDYSLNITIMTTELLISLIQDAVSRNYKSISRDIFQRQVHQLRLFGYPVQGFVPVIDSMKTYLSAHMALLSPDTRRELFVPDRPIYTKVRDEMPAKYGISSHVSNSLIADGCVIEGAVHQCILFRGVTVGPGASLENCILMQGTDVGADARLEYVMTDKDVKILERRTLIGFESYPAFISKGVTV